MWSSQCPEICHWGRNLEGKNILGHPKPLKSNKKTSKMSANPNSSNKAIFDKSELKKKS